MAYLCYGLDYILGALLTEDRLCWVMGCGDLILDYIRGSLPLEYGCISEFSVIKGRYRLTGVDLRQETG